MRFIQLLTSTDPITAVRYGQQHFNTYGDKHYSGKSMHDMNIDDRIDSHYGACRD